MNPNADDGVPPYSTPAAHASGISVLLAIVMGILLLASNAAWTVVFLMTQGSAPAQQSQNNQPNNNGSSDTAPSGFRSIPEIGAKFGLDNDTKKLTYAYVHDSNGTYIGFSTVPLTDKNVRRSLTTYDCISNNGPVGRLQVLQPGGSYSGQTVEELVTAGKAKQIKDLYVMYLAPTAKCSDDPTVNAIADSGVLVAKKAFLTLVAE